MADRCDDNDKTMRMSMIFSGLNNSQVVICNTAQQLIEILNYHDWDIIREYWLEKIKKSTPSKQMFLFFLLNDFLLLAIKKQKSSLIVKIIDFIMESVKYFNINNPSKINKILMIWKSQKVFSHEMLHTIHHHLVELPQNTNHDNSYHIHYRKENDSTNNQSKIMSFHSFDLEQIDDLHKICIKNVTNQQDNSKINDIVNKSKIDFKSINSNINSNHLGTNRSYLEEKLTQLCELEKSLSDTIKEYAIPEDSMNKLLENLDDLQGCTCHQTNLLKQSLLNMKEFIIKCEDKISKFKKTSLSSKDQISQQIEIHKNPSEFQFNKNANFTTNDNNFLQNKITNLNDIYKNDLESLQKQNIDDKQQFKGEFQTSKVNNQKLELSLEQIKKNIDLQNINSQVFSNILTTINKLKANDEKTIKNHQEPINIQPLIDSKKTSINQDDTNFHIENLKEFVDHLPKLDKQ